jgi:hypothetical protein
MELLLTRNDLSIVTLDNQYYTQIIYITHNY